MYVIFPLDELLDLNSARGNKRRAASLYKPSHTRPTEEVLPISQPNQLLPNQLKPPLSKQPLPKTTTSLKPPTPSPTRQQKAPPSQKQPTPTQKAPLSKASSKTSLSVTPPSIVVPPSPPVSVLSSNQAVHVKKPPHGTTNPTATTTTTTPPTTTIPPNTITQPLTDQVTLRQRSSHSSSTETSSNSSTGARGKALLSPQAPGGTAANRSSWGGTPFQESCPTRSGSFKAFKDLTVSTEGSSLKIVEQPSRSGSVQDIAGSTQQQQQQQQGGSKPPLQKQNSFRSHLSDSCATRPRLAGISPLRKPQTSVTATSKQSSPTSVTATSKQSSPASETPKKPQEPAEQLQPAATLPLPQGHKTAEGTAAAAKAEVVVQAPKEKPTAAVEGVKIRKEAPVQGAAPTPAYSQQLTAAESLRIQQECLPSPDSSKAVPPNQRHPSGKSNRSSGSQKLPDFPPSGGTTRGVAAAGSSSSSSANPNRTQGVLGSPRGPQQKNTAMASNEATFRDLTNQGHNESLKAHNAFTFKLVKTGPSSGALEESRLPDGT